jgi:prepilin-type N-terminal cleavage/methylation domain-containing protein
MASRSLKSRLFKSRLLRSRRASRRRRNSGFTLTELLISIIISSIVVMGLLYMVVELLGTDARESARNETQREMQLSMDYITSELREAVYVYDDLDRATADAEALSNYLPDFGATATPVLAFWKPVTVDLTDVPGNCESLPDDKENECETLKIRRNSYSLVVYMIDTADPNDIWDGSARITRYEMSKYPGNQPDNALTQTDGYVDPTNTDTTFGSWPENSAGDTLQNEAPTNSNAPVLVDFLDDPTNTDFDADPNDDTAELPTCDTGYARQPADTTITSFFACVSNVSGAADSDGRPANVNQDVLVYLRGNSNGRRGSQDSEAYFPMQSQVLVGGVINKVPPQ